MGFTQKASCRPYKNCYKGGSKKTEIVNIKMPKSLQRQKPTLKKRSTLKRKRNTIRKSKKNGSSIRVFQQSYSYSSNPAPGKPYGHLVKVSYANGKGQRSEANLDKSGKPINIKTTPV